jgi:tRNA-5-taurinomethyluridine 2-sulfurtransferase
MQVCEQLGVPLTTVPLTKQYWDRVVSHCVKEIHSGRTPNPDVLCNSRVKFGAFFEYLQTHPAQFDRVATGHYARVHSQPRLYAKSSSEASAETSAPEQALWTHHSDSSSDTIDAEIQHQPGKVQLMLTPDSWKDQTYFLANLSQQQLHRVLLPLGHLTKKKVRELATLAQLPTMSRKDSQGICFLGKVKFSEFIKVLLPSLLTHAFNTPKHLSISIPTSMQVHHSMC